MLGEIKIITNNVPRDIVEAYELPIELRDKEFSYLDWEAINKGEDSASFIKYKGEWYDLQDFSRTEELHPGHIHEWDGYQSDSFFSGIVVKWAKDDAGHTDFERVIVGRYYS